MDSPCRRRAVAFFDHAFMALRKTLIAGPALNRSEMRKQPQTPPTEASGLPFQDAA
jgi:hypothetical protein